MNSFFTLHSFLEVGKTQDLPSKFWQTLGYALTSGIVLYSLFLFHPPTYREMPMTTTIRARIYTRGEVSFAKLV
jgi:hypothetical protein